MLQVFQSTFKAYLVDNVYAKLNEFDKPTFINLNFPSVKGVERGCIISDSECIDFDVINNLGANSQSLPLEIDLLTQVEMYNAAFGAINDLEWVKGVISLEYNPQVAIMDFSSSVRGKPAIGVFWYWYPRMLGIEN